MKLYTPLATQVGIALLLLPLVLSCGRFRFEDISGGFSDAVVIPPRIDAGTDATADLPPSDAGTDATVALSIDAGVDATVALSIDAGVDATVALSIDAGVDATVAPPIDAGVDATVVVSADAGSDATVVVAPDAGPDAAVCTGSCTDPLADDPFGDNTDFAYVAAHGGKLYFGPSEDGTRVARSLPDGTNPELLGFTFPRDTTGALSTSRNLFSPPYSSIGTSGCTADTLACGPDNEDGRGLLAAATLGGVEWLVLGGGRTLGDLDYVYMVSNTTAPLAFRYADISVAMGPQTKGFSALHGYGERIYMGFPDTGGLRPYLLALLVPPPAPGLDAVLGSDVLQLHAELIPGFATLGTAMIDSINDFQLRVYIANSGAWARSRIEFPVSSPGDWVVITPSAAAYAAKVSMTTSKVIDLLPTDRAVPQIASYGGRLYVARNTTVGPQLWMCNPAIGGAALHCDSGDWTLILANTVGDTQLSQLNNAANTSIGMLVATPTDLYVGFNNASGIAVFRSNALTPVAAADFRGEADCSAANHPASCTGLGGPGLGNPSNTQIFSAATPSIGAGTSVYVSAGSGTSGFRIHRLF